MFFKIISILCFGFITYSASHEFGTNDAKKYLSNFGYMQNSIPHPNSLPQGKSSDGTSPDNHLSGALTRFQEYFSLPVTGKLDTKTVSKMKAPRCGFKDIQSPNAAKKNSMFQRFTYLGPKFEKRKVTYAIVQYTNQFSKEVIDDTIRRAFEVWSAVVPLTFSQKQSGPVDIYIGFYRFQHRRPNSYYLCESFDGPSRILVHAQPPSPNMFLHFDDDERWVLGPYWGTHLFQVAVHEIGHNIGLGHTNVPGAVMFPDYRFMPNFRLHSDDIRGAQVWSNKEVKPFLEEKKIIHCRVSK